jgi:hypothetical protein
MVVILGVRDMLKLLPYISSSHTLSGVKEKGRGFYDSKIRRKMKKLTIYIVKHRPSTKHSAESKPCSHCAREIKRLGIKKIVYVDAFGGVNKKLSRDYHTDYVCPGYKEYARLNVKVD